MKLRSIETTPNPNCMMLKVDTDFGNRSVTIEANDPNLDQVPPVVRSLLDLPGVRSVFLSRDFITLTRRGGADWGPILAGADRLLGAGDGAGTPGTDEATNTRIDLDRVDLAVLEFRCLPSQIRATSAEVQARVALPDRFSKELARVLGAVNASYLRERQWRPLNPRFGDPAVIAQMVADELDSSIPDDLLTRLGAAAITEKTPTRAAPEQRPQEELLADLTDPDWKHRLAAIQSIKIDDVSFPVIITALTDPKPAVRRWAAAALGSSGRSEAVSSLSSVVVSDASVVVRRTAGDALSDLGNPAAISAMCQSLSDTSHLVRWRAARYLNEQGDDSAIAPLDAAIAAESDFGVRLEMTTARERIQSGGESQMPMWLRLSGGVRKD